MEDSDAKYLIDQFNKYISWKLARWNYVTPWVAVLVATMAIAYSVGGFYQKVPYLPYPYDIMAFLIGLVFLIILGIAGTVFVRGRDREIGSFEELLVMLEDYRSKHKSLPDTISFRLIVKKPEEVKKLLGASERSVTEKK